MKFENIENNEKEHSLEKAVSALSELMVFLEDIGLKVFKYDIEESLKEGTPFPIVKDRAAGIRVTFKYDRFLEEGLGYKGMNFKVWFTNGFGDHPEDPIRIKVAEKWNQILEEYFK